MRLILAIGGVLLAILTASADETRTPEGIVIHTDESQHAIETGGLERFAFNARHIRRP